MNSTRGSGLRSSTSTSRVSASTISPTRSATCSAWGYSREQNARAPIFSKRYEQLLRLTGSDSAEGVAKRCLGVDLEQPDFWHASIDLIENGIGRAYRGVRR